MNGIPDRVLEGVEVLELGTAIAGPFAGKLLADNGARVLKVEPLSGEDYRRRRFWYDRHDSEEFTHRFVQYNTGKESIAVDVKTERGAEVLRELLAGADVLIENMRAGVMERLGFGWEEIHDRNPELIYCSVTGYGEDGPYADRPAADHVIQGVSGWVEAVGTTEEPRLMTLYAIDHTTAMYAAMGVLLALIERATSGTGQRFEVAMMDAAISYLGHQLAELSAARQYGLGPSFESSVAPAGVYGTADDHVTILVLPERWGSFCGAIGREEWAEEGHRFSTLDGRREHREELDARLGAVLGERAAEEWITRFGERAPGVLIAPINGLADLPGDPQVRHRGSIVERDQPGMGEELLAAPPLRFSRSDVRIGDAPRLGEHTDAVLESLGYTGEEIAGMYEDEIVAGP